MKVWRTVILLSFLSVGTAGLMSCSQKQEQDCGFVQNVYGERISWKKTLPAKVSIHESVPEDMRPAIYKAAQKWNELLGREVISIEGVSHGENKAQKDGSNVIYMSSKWDAGKETEQGRTSVYWIGNEIKEADIRINDENFDFYWQSSTQQRAVNFEALVLHELGHVLGLKHRDASLSVMQTYLASNTDRTNVGRVDLESLKCEY